MLAGGGMASVLVRMLADGAFHSGGELAAALGISRAAVWKQVRKLGETGLLVHAVRGKGYRVSGGIDLLDAGQIRSGLSADAAALIDDLDVFDVVDSTNAVAMSRSRAGGGSYACLAERQTAGRGRLGRPWVSPYAANIYLSLVREFAGGVAVTEGLSLAVGVAVCDAVRELGVDQAMLKWPNDLVSGEQKLGGILIELSGDLSGNCRAVIGVGINVRMSAETAGGIDQPWQDLRSLGMDAPRNVVAAKVLSALLPAIRTFEDRGLEPFMDRWQRYDACRGRQVKLLGAGRDSTGVVLGIDSNGGLLLETQDGIRTFKGGEISLRGWA